MRMTGRMATVLALTGGAGCAAPPPPLDPIRVNVNEGEVRMIAARNLIARYGATTIGTFDERTAPCVVATAMPEEVFAVAVDPANLDVLFGPMMSRGEALYCLQGGAL